MRIVEPCNRLSYDVEDFITNEEFYMNQSEEQFRKLLNYKLRILKQKAFEIFNLRAGI